MLKKYFEKSFFVKREKSQIITKQPQNLSHHKNKVRITATLEVRVYILSAFEKKIFTLHTTLNNYTASLLRFSIDFNADTIDAEVKKKTEFYSNSNVLLLLKIFEDEFNYQLQKKIIYSYFCVVDLPEIVHKKKKIGGLSLIEINNVKNLNASSYLNKCVDFIKLLAIQSDRGCLLCVFFLDNCFSRAELRSTYEILTGLELTDYAFNKALESVEAIKKIRSEHLKKLGYRSVTFQVNKSLLSKELILTRTLTIKL